jgi:nitrate/nitrite transporter NarK
VFQGSQHSYTSSSAAAPNVVPSYIRHLVLKLCLTVTVLFTALPACPAVVMSCRYDQFRLNAVVAGAMGSIFGCMNIFTRASGGIISGKSRQSALQTIDRFAVLERNSSTAGCQYSTTCSHTAPRLGLAPWCADSVLFV